MRNKLRIPLIVLRTVGVEAVGANARFGPAAGGREHRTQRAPGRLACISHRRP